MTSATATPSTHLPIAYRRIDSPVGALLIAASDAGLHGIEFPENRHPLRRTPGWHEGDHPMIDLARRQLEEYFAGRRQQFTLPLAPAGTDFQRKVWNTLAAIPFGSTWSYGQLALRVGKPSASRAVGAANGRNPLPIVLPCHRVIGSSGAMTGFGGGLPTKEFLLRLEGALPDRGASSRLFD
ncbi:methylated-DNA--[protein]-cysteine S-methyltransferase [Pseudoxanthomonas composti]|uniref:Methylated-DNA--protein-cysteine methyltransferase n=1 Tax=Pseudoxanthomonas composti TaxID=2137479 RepID=A0A4Q1JWV0_9GAMM|nr:methylated-DNA--[protein]-cysteine S-methyltransferase [Pseudoxanthomonas composti]RXR05383.1 methylated-DNA--[protein]-cysteine S-methyltransferase [Pseudoxanthomonas composti]